MKWSSFMDRKLSGKFSIAAAFLLVVAILTLPLQIIEAGLPKPTPGQTTNIITKLQSARTTNLETNQVDGRSIEQAPIPFEVEESPANRADQQTYYSIADATVLEGYPDLNFGATTDMWAGYDDSLDPHGQIARSLIKFDLASLTSDQVITQATLRVYLVGSWDFPDTERTIETYQVTENWSEDNVNWNNKPGYGSVYGSESIFSEAWGWYEFDVTELVTAWCDGTYANFGVMLRGPEVSGNDSSWRAFGTRESDYIPELVILTSSDETPTATLTPTQTGTQTATITPTPTATPTPTPTKLVKRLGFLPLISKILPPTPTPTPPTPKLARVYVDNDTGGQLCYEVLDTGVGEKCFPVGEHHYGNFAPGTYSWKASARCGSLSGSRYFSSGEWTHRFWCGASMQTEIQFGSQ
jgi:hypothetical protein